MEQSPHTASEDLAVSQRESGWVPLWMFLLALFALSLLKLFLGLVPVPVGMVQPITLLVTVIFVAVPIYALFRAASIEWTAKIGFVMVLAGLAIHIGLQYIGAYALNGQGVGAAIALA